MRPQFALLASAALLLSGCASSGVGSESTAPSALAGDWTLVSGSDGDGDFELAGTTITLTVDDDAVSGRAPCNGYRGTAAADGATVSFSELSTTRAACRVQSLMDLERRYIDALGAATAVRVDGAALELGDGSGPVLRFQPVVEGTAGDSTDLAGTAWTLTTVMSGDVAAAAIGTGSLAFAPDGLSVTGSAGCHDFSAGFASAGGVATLSALEIAHQACTDETAVQEDSVFAVLGDGLVVSRDGDTLTATNAVDGVPVSLVYSFQAS
jgi:heat shock protein HslJ